MYSCKTVEGRWGLEPGYNITTTEIKRQSAWMASTWHSTCVLMHQVTCRQEDKPGQQWQSAFKLSTTSVSSLASVMEEHKDR